jgi:hypothetical protein
MNYNVTSGIPRIVVCRNPEERQKLAIFGSEMENLVISGLAQELDSTWTWCSERFWEGVLMQEMSECQPNETIHVTEEAWRHRRRGKDWRKATKK